MAIAIFMRTTGQQGDTGYKNNDVVEIIEDSQVVGLKVNPATNPNSIFQLVDIPGVLRADLLWSLEVDFTTPTGPPQSQNRAVIKKRNFSMQVSLLPIADRPTWLAGGRISITEAEYTTAVALKPGGPPQ